MKKETLYTYLGTNGTLTTTIHLEGIQSMTQYKLSADKGKTLTDGNRKVQFVVVYPNELENWTEIDA